MENKVILIGTVAEMLQVSQSSINRWCEESRKGLNTFPLPISARGGKRRWLRSDVERYLDSLSTVTPFPARKQRHNTKAFQTRQNVADKALAKYRTRGEQ